MSTDFVDTYTCPKCGVTWLNIANGKCPKCD